MASIATSGWRRIAQQRKAVQQRRNSDVMKPRKKPYTPPTRPVTPKPISQNQTTVRRPITYKREIYPGSELAQHLGVSRQVVEKYSVPARPVQKRSFWDAFRPSSRGRRK